MNRFETLVEKKIREAMDRGEFDDLPGKGQPISLEENPFEDPDLRLVHRLLCNAGFAPAWIEERKEIDTAFAAARTKLLRAWVLFGKDSRRSLSSEWQRSAAEFYEGVRKLNERIKIYNLKAPALVFHRRQIDGDKVMQEVQEQGGAGEGGQTKQLDQ
jgi:DnaJ homolog subfamily C member 28